MKGLRFFAGMAALVPLLLAAHAAQGAQPGETLSNVGSVPREAAGARDLARLDGETFPPI